MEKYCVYCDQSQENFAPYRDGKPGPIIAALDVIGSDLQNFSCVNCGSFDRERHLKLYFDSLNLWKNFDTKSILHVAPENHFGKLVESKAKQYRAVDLYPTDPTIARMDLTRTGLKSRSIDVVIANHVLEHIPNDVKALREISRILRPGGFAVLQTPYSAKLKVGLEIKSIDTPELKNLFYGQEDHVRLYGADLFRKIEARGLVVERISHSKITKCNAQYDYGVNSREDLLLARKPKNEFKYLSK